MKAGWVYILECSDGTYYTGSTSSLDCRMVQHQTGTLGGYTASRLPILLVFQQQFPDIREAISAERRIKGWSRAKKDALIRGDFALLRKLSRSRA
jgi:putative endonuclease